MDVDVLKTDQQRRQIQEDKTKAVNISLTTLRGTSMGTTITQRINPAYKY